jgi:hypothetical protein
MRLSLLVVVVLAVSTGCGLRSDPLYEGIQLEGGSDDDDDDDSGDDGPTESRCTDPIAMPAQNVKVKGTLEGDNTQGGWCGDDDGPEIVYELLAPYTTDITFRVLSSDVPLTLRVDEGVCGDESKTKICAGDFSTLPRHFLALGATTYYITVDTDDPDGGDFEFEVVYGWPALTDCPVHETQIIQEPGGQFQWFNEFGKSQGQVDGFCGGPGRENMFQVMPSYIGNMHVEVVGSNGFEPVVSLRTNCAAVSEVTCQAGGPNGFVSADWLIENPEGLYFVEVDQVGYAGGAFELVVTFD